MLVLFLLLAEHVDGWTKEKDLAANRIVVVSLQETMRLSWGITKVNSPGARERWLSQSQTCEIHSLSIWYYRSLYGEE